MDFRIFRELTCRYCAAPATFQVYEDQYSPSYKLACDEHKHLPYSKQEDDFA
jgi:hypothetical protein